MFDEDEYEEVMGFPFGNFEYGYAVNEPPPKEAAGRIEQFVRENPGWSRRELAKEFSVSADKVASALKAAEGHPATTVKSPRPKQDGDPKGTWVYGWLFPEEANEYEQYLSDRLGQILGSINNLAAFVDAVEYEAADPHTPLCGVLSGRAGLAARAIHQLDALRYHINRDAKHAARDEDDEEGWEDIL